MMCGTVENRVLEWRATVAVCQNSRKRWLLGVSVQLFWRSLRNNSLGRPENCYNLDEFCYYGASSVYECFSEVYMGNPGIYIVSHTEIAK